MVKCGLCDKDNTGGVESCIHCGAPLTKVSAPSTTDSSASSASADFMPGVRTIKIGGAPPPTQSPAAKNAPAAMPASKIQGPLDSIAPMAADKQSVADSPPENKQAAEKSAEPDQAAMPRLEDLMQPGAKPSAKPKQPEAQTTPTERTPAAVNTKPSPLSDKPTTLAPKDIKPLENKAYCKDCGAEITPQSCKIYEGRSVCPVCYHKLNAPPLPSRVSLLTPADILLLLKKPWSYLFSSSYKSSPWPFFFFLLVGSFIYILTYTFLASLDEPGVTLSQTIVYFFHPLQMLNNIGIILTNAGLTIGGIALAHLIGKKLGGRGSFREVLNLGTQVYGLVYHLECAVLVLILPFALLLSGRLTALESVLRVPFHLYAAALLLLGIKRIHWLDWKLTAIAALTGSALILGLSYIF